MKSMYQRMLVLFSALLILGFTYAQEKEKSYQMYAVHEDIVKPSKVTQYEAVAKEFKMVMDKYKNEVPDLHYLAVSTDNMHYMYVWPIDSMADLDKNPLAEVRNKMGADKFDDMMARMDDCYSSHTTYTMTLDKNMTYMPEGISQTQEGENYREFHYYYTSPAKLNNLAKKGMAIKEFHASNNSPASYRIYRSGFGAPKSFFMVAVSAKDPSHMAQKSQEIYTKLGPEYQKALNEAMNYTTKYDKVTGWIRPDLSVEKVKTTASKK